MFPLICLSYYLFYLFIYSLHFFLFRIRQSTYDQLKMLKNGILSKVLEAVLLFDPISPILNKFHLRAIDRRLHQLLTTIDKCVKEQGMPNVIISEEKLIPEKHVET